MLNFILHGGMGNWMHSPLLLGSKGHNVAIVIHLILFIMEAFRSETSLIFVRHTSHYDAGCM